MRRSHILVLALCILAMAGTSALPVTDAHGATGQAWGQASGQASGMALDEAAKAVMREASDAYGKRDFAKAIALLTPEAEKGNAHASFSLGLMAVRGDGMPMSVETAAVWWQMSAEGGHPDAMYHLGRLYFQGLIGRDIALAREWWTRAADAGQGDAMFALAQVLRAGDGGEPDPKGAAARFTQAANLGHPMAMYQLALMYREGDGVAKDAGKAASWMRKAAAAGLPEAKQELGK